MPEFLFQLKGKNSESYTGNWSWPPIWQDKVEAENKKSAHLAIEDMFGKKFPLRVLQKDLDSNEFLLIIREIKDSDRHTKDLFVERACLQCGKPYTLNEKYQQGNSGGGHHLLGI